VSPLADTVGRGEAVLVGAGTADDAGVYRLGDRALIATADFIPPVCDDPRRYGRVAAVNALSDVYAMGGRPLFALNLCCLPGVGVPDGVLAAVLAGGADALIEAGAVLLGGHSVSDPELKFGLAVIGEADPGRILSNDRASPGERLILTKPLGTGVMINAFKAGKLDAAGLEPALAEMERLNAAACRLALEHGVAAATDVTGFGLAGHALNIGRNSGVGIEVSFDALPVHDAFRRCVEAGVSTGCTGDNEDAAATFFEDRRGLSAAQRELLFDPQTSGGLLLPAPPERAEALLDALRAEGHQAAEIGVLTDGPPRFTVV
jgi:selenide, water dikinase